ncbi:MAG: hypothetical protein QG570_545 [Patescibacteria group bacterium]|nr:hypothetical protein [Patescibacteria group bacterium]
MPAAISSIAEGLSESETESSPAMDTLGISDNPCLNESEKWYIGRILGNLTTSPDTNKDFTNSDLLKLSNEEINEAINSVTEREGVQVDFEEVLATKTQRTLPHFPFSGPIERIGSAVITIAYNQEQTIGEVLKEGAANCLDWAAVMQVVGRARYPSSKATIVPYGSRRVDQIDDRSKRTRGYRSHYGIAFIDTEGALSYSVMGGDIVADHEFENLPKLLDSFKDYLRKPGIDETAVIAKANKLMIQYQSLRRNYAIGISKTMNQKESKSSIADRNGELFSIEEVAWRLESAKILGDPKKILELQASFPSYQPSG